MRAARVGARLFAARNECLEEVEDDCDDKEYERHGVPSETGVFPCLRCHVSTLNVKKTFRNSEKKRIWMILLFSGGASRQCRGRRSLAQGCRNIASVDFLGEQKRRQCRYPAVSARQTLLFERRSAAPNIVNIIAVRQAATGYGTEMISERAPAFPRSSRA